LDDLVQVADRATLHRAGERAIHPAGALAFKQIAADQVARGEVLVAGDGDDGERLILAVRADRGGVRRSALLLDHRERPAKLIGHVLDKARLAAAGRTFEQHRNLLLEGGAEQFDLVTYADVIRLVLRRILFDGV